MALVSIIIPTFNRAHWLQTTIPNILQQRDAEWELLVVDDGSTDTTAQLVQSVTDPRVRYIYHEHGERSPARNFGLQQARGEFVLFADDDDLLHPDFLSRARQVQAKTHAGVVHAGIRLIDAKGNFLPQAPTIPSAHQDILRALLVENFGLASALVKRDWVERVGGFDETLTAAEDWDLWIRLAAENCVFAPVPEALIYYRMHDANTVQNWLHMESHGRLVLMRALERYAARTAPYRQNALARQQFRHAIQRSVHRDIPGAIQCLSDGFRIYPPLCQEPAVYYQAFCSTQPRGYEGTDQFIDLEIGAALVFGALANAFHDTSSSELNAMRSKAYALAHETLARLYYKRRELKPARQHFWRALQIQPSRAREIQFALRFSKALVPLGVLRNLERVRQKTAA